jgi:hypothetical protein
MSSSPEGQLAAVAGLRTALEDAAAALASADLKRLLGAETALQSALEVSHSPFAVPAGDQQAFRDALEGAAAALLRCRRLGAGLSDFVRISLVARGEQVGYEPARTAAASLTGRGLSQRA